MLTIHKKVVKDVNGNPKEVIIPWEEYKKIEESLGLDLSQEAIEDLKQAKIDRDNSNKDAYVDLESIQMFKIIVHKRALKYLNKLTSFRKTKIKKLLTELTNNPI